MTATSQKFSKDLAAATLFDLTQGGLALADQGSYLVTFCNRNAAEVSVRLAITTGAAPTIDEYIEYDAKIDANGVLSRWPVPLSQGWKLYAYASVSGVSVSAIGRKE